MATGGRSARHERAYFRAIAIQDRRANGHWLPVIRHLAQRRLPEAMVVLANHEAGAKPAAARGLLRRAWRMGSVVAAYDLAIDHFNRDDLHGYRHWLTRAARAGDDDAALQLRRFERRLPHGDARRIGRHRPMRRDEA